MVTPLLIAQAWRPNISDMLLAEQAAGPVLERLDPPRRAAVIMSLLALILVGMLLVAIAMLGANWARRQARHRPRSRRSSTHIAAGTNPQMRESLQDIVPNVKSDDTVQINPGAGDTTIGH